MLSDLLERLAASGRLLATPSETGSPSDCDPLGTPINLGDPTPGATDNWQTTKTNGVGYKIPAKWTGHWADASVKTIDFQVFVKSQRTGVVTRFMGELPPGKKGKFLLNNFVPTIQP
jgi:hypothetical protein